MLGGVSARKLHRLKTDVEACVADIASGIGCSERKFYCGTYRRSFLFEGEWKKSEPMVQRLNAIDRAERGYVQALQQFVNQGNWEDGLIRENMRQWVGSSFVRAYHVSVHHNRPCQPC